MSQLTLNTNSNTQHDPPVGYTRTVSCAAWMDHHFGDQVAAAVKNTPFEKDLIYAIACQETAICWSAWINDHTPEEILARCVFDASGDANGTRVAFPKNTAAFIAKYGHDLANMLIAEANATRALHGWGPKQWVYAGYGIFQYDIQNIINDQAFFEQKQWYSIEACLDRMLRVLNAKWHLHTGNLTATVKAYNGSGPRADQYANNVLLFLNWIKAAR